MKWNRIRKYSITSGCYSYLAFQSANLKFREHGAGFITVTDFLESLRGIYAALIYEDLVSTAIDGMSVRA